ncbi:MAG: GAF domain-containing protein [Sulfuricurvum sp.]|jgi:signal transduction histidine kinase|uniref:GAF domain-containing protein n=1 Tax=Sulfuricurvum sp. TaxID=2025608 RepID=UPI0025D99504|nr:GAF domain-containing protein [Sulfuricurvum sp.]MCK9374347.1 GAF domain-containing protein [Sulfuricurvum sp.]
MTSHTDSALFIRTIWQTLIVLILFAIFFGVYVYSEKQIDRANEMRLYSFTLADELRQSSDDLTRMVRTYVVTDNPIYKKHYQEILDIRNGRKPRPLMYQNIYWDLVGLDDERPRPFASSTLSLLERMRQAGFSEIELAKLSEAKKESDLLTRTEYAAMKLIESQGSDSQKMIQKQKALGLLHDAAYHQAKASIMKPIDEFYRLMNERTVAAIHTAKTVALILRIIFVLIGFFLLFMLWRLNQTLNHILGGSVTDVHDNITRIGGGDFSLPIGIDERDKGSVLGWLSEMQGRLNDLIAYNERLKQLYVTLSQCNQAIVRSKNEGELFPILCRNAVDFGGMKMAWIGKPDQAGSFIKPVAYYGEGGSYLEGLIVSADSSDVFGRGPTGYAFHNHRPFWCQDFANDPATEPWHERGKEFGWGGSAALPLEYGGKVVAVFTLYTSSINAFDTSTKELLEEMARDISYALESFEHAIAHQTAELKLAEEKQMTQNYLDIIVESEQFYRTLFASVYEAIVILNNTMIIDCNDMALTLFETERDDFIGRSILEYPLLFQENDLSYYLASAEQTNIIECSVTMKNSIKSKIIEIIISGFGNATGKLILVARDITQKLEHENLFKMQARQAQLGEMIAMIAHQWRQPLAIINAIASQILLTEMMKKVEDKSLINNLMHIEEQCAHLSQTISDYRELSNPNKPKERMAVSKLLQHAVNLMDHAFKNNGVALRQMIVQDLEVATYRNEVVQVLLTIFKNALDAFEEKKINKRILTLTLDHDEQFAIIRIHDNAGGIVPEVRDRIFTPYFTTKQKTNGTGLGLYMSKITIKERCNGALEVSSEGEETVFSIKLPR